MFIVNPLRRRGQAAADLTSTHPPISERVRILRAMGGAAYADYDAAWRRVTGRKRGLPPSALRLRDALSRLGIDATVIELPVAARTSQQAADAGGPHEVGAEDREGRPDAREGDPVRAGQQPDIHLYREIHPAAPNGIVWGDKVFEMGNVGTGCIVHSMPWDGPAPYEWPTGMYQNDYAFAESLINDHAATLYWHDVLLTRVCHWL